MVRSYPRIAWRRSPTSSVCTPVIERSHFVNCRREKHDHARSAQRHRQPDAAGRSQRPHRARCWPASTRVSFSTPGNSRATSESPGRTWLTVGGQINANAVSVLDPYRHGRGDRLLRRHFYRSAGRTLSTTSRCWTLRPNRPKPHPEHLNDPVRCTPGRRSASVAPAVDVGRLVAFLLGHAIPGACRGCLLPACRLAKSRAMAAPYHLEMAYCLS